MKHFQRSAMIGAALTLLFTTDASASYTTEFDTSISFGGTSVAGTQNANFVRTYNADEGIELGMKAVTRFAADVENAGNRYSVDQGALSNTAMARWDFALAFDLGSRKVSDFDVQLSIDFDAAAGVTDFVILDFNDPNVGGSSFSQFSNRVNLGDSYWQSLYGAPAFDANAIGDYEIVLSITNRFSGELLAESRIFADNNVQVVPVPSAALSGLGLLVTLGVYRRIRK